MSDLHSAVAALDLGTPPPIHPNAEVDAQPAIIDGRTGGPALVEVPEDDSTVLRDLAEAMAVEARLRTVANTAKNALTAASKRTKAAAEHAAEFYNRTRQLGLTLTTGGTDPAPEDGDEGEGDENE